MASQTRPHQWGDRYILESKRRKHQQDQGRMWQKIRGGFLVGLGYMLSPLSWWNDIFFNLPIAYGFGWLINLFFPGSLILATIIGYWLSNVLGFVLMQFGVGDMLFSERPRNPTKDLLMSLGTSTLYTVVIVILLQFNILETPDFLLPQAL
ncbi:MAG: hypothetical protein VKJ64_03525 [Leptolyngbyaceae bacterium]|nr:hypothetical protein [Leptolyngbyaceae bacterium]